MMARDPIACGSRFQPSASSIPLRFKGVILLRDSVVGLLPDRRQNILGRGIVAKRLTHMDKEVFVSRRKHKAAAQLQRVFAQAMLLVASGLGALAGLHVVAPQKVEQGSVLQANGFVGFALLVNQQRELDAGFFAEELGVTGVTQADYGDLRSFAAELLLEFAQLRDVFSTENSAVMAQKNQHRRAAFPQRAQPR
jgi:hypothetical protein